MLAVGAWPFGARNSDLLIVWVGGATAPGLALGAARWIAVARRRPGRDARSASRQEAPHRLGPGLRADRSPEAAAAPECWPPGARFPEVLSHSAALRAAAAFPARVPPSDARAASAGSHAGTEFAAAVTGVARSPALAASHAAAASDEERAAGRRMGRRRHRRGGGGGAGCGGAGRGGGAAGCGGGGAGCGGAGAGFGGAGGAGCAGAAFASLSPGRLEQPERASHPATALPMALRLYALTADRIVLARRTDFVTRISAPRPQRVAWSPRRS